MKHIECGILLKKKEVCKFRKKSENDSTVVEI